MFTQVTQTLLATLFLILTSAIFYKKVKKLDSNKKFDSFTFELAKYTLKSSSSSQLFYPTGLPFCDDLYEDHLLNDNVTIPSRYAQPANYNLSTDMLDLPEFLKETGVKDGCWCPDYCTVRQTITIIVPYRDREVHKISFLLYMHRFLQKQHRDQGGKSCKSFRLFCILGYLETKNFCC